MAILRRQKVIQNAADLHEFAQENLQVPSEKASLRRRIFLYIEQHDRDRNRRSFKEVKGNRAIHSISANGQSKHLKTRELSCYCDHCIGGDFEIFEIKKWEEHILEQEVPERGYKKR